jgi:hypothetical protein
VSAAAPLDTCGCCEESSPGTPEAVWNRPGLSRIDYRIGTYATFRQAMLRAAGRRSALLPWTARTDDDYGVAALDLWAYVADVLTFYQERVANEAYLRTAMLRDSVLRLGRLLGYRPSPGVAASAELAFTVEPGKRLRVPAGLRVQSVPGPDEKPQKFETVAGIEARAAISRMPARPPLTTVTPFAAGSSGGDLDPQRAADVSARIAPGAQLVLYGSGVLEEKRLTELEERDGLMRVVWEPPVRQAGIGKVHAVRRRFRLFGWDAPPKYLHQSIASGVVTLTEVATGGSIPGGGTYSFALNTSTLPLAQLADDLETGAKLLLYRGSGAPTEHTISALSTGPETKGPLSATVTRVTLTPPPGPISDLRTVELYEVVTDVPLATKGFGAQISGARVLVELARGVELEEGRRIVLDDAAASPHSADVTQSLPVDADGDGRLDHLQVDFTPGLPRSLDTASAVLLGNVAPATHGETVARELLGTGDASLPFQRFALKDGPLTFVASPGAPRGAASTLELRVGGLRWDRVETRYGLGPDARVYTAELDPERRTLVEGGDGRTGARLPTGAQVVARYRKGIGRDGNVPAGSLTSLLAKPKGLKSASNPAAATGGAEPETLEDARTSAPETVRTLGRIVSLQDFEDAARESVLVAKARAAIVWTGTQEGVRLTVAGDRGAHVVGTALADLRKDLDSRRDPFRRLDIVDYRDVPVRVEAAIVAHDPARAAEDVVEAARQALIAHFDFDSREFGQPVHLSDVFAVLGSATGVDGVDLQRLQYAQTADANSHLPVTLRSRAVLDGLPIGTDELAVLRTADLVVVAT